ncbi:ORF6N domain-containing protein [Lutibacter sp.]|uniref:ORF6N domain-containing protein n=1 Tax=Lutibacter sp. TaxID=1925666 RepID=UPI0027368E87|nr:ORF6N domain-containing protein [Lutibacter sp.]MDP3314083.1 ORF6N domain-containing protein [Lutibacter sp.]
MELQLIQNKIYEIRGQRIMLDFDLAEMYETETKRLKEAVRRNVDRFPEDFMFQLSKDEYENLRTQSATSSHGGTRYMPFAFTEQGVAMLSSVLNSKKAIQVNIAVIRAFVVLRQHLADYKDLKENIAILEKQMNINFKDINQALNYLLGKDQNLIQNQQLIDQQLLEQQNRKSVGFKK